MANRQDVPPRRPASFGVAKGRLPRILLGYAAGCLAAAFALPIGLLIHDAIVYGPGRALGSAGVSGVWIIAVFAFGIAVVLAAPAAVAFVLYTESRRVTSPLAHGLFGALTGLVVEAIAMLFAMANPTRSNLAALVLFAAIGALGGLVYWAVAVPRPAASRRAPPAA